MVKIMMLVRQLGFALRRFMLAMFLCNLLEQMLSRMQRLKQDCEKHRKR